MRLQGEQLFIKDDYKEVPSAKYNSLTSPGMFPFPLT